MPEPPVRQTVRQRRATVLAPRRDEAERGLGAPIGVVRTMPPARALRIEEPSWASSRGVVRRALRVASAATPTDADDWPPPRRGWPETWPAAPSHQVSSATAQRAAQLDVQRVTDQVMRQIDRRLAAWRERTGRV